MKTLPTAATAVLLGSLLIAAPAVFAQAPGQGAEAPGSNAASAASKHARASARSTAIVMRRGLWTRHAPACNEAP
jgi:hypothetical protein